MIKYTICLFIIISYLTYLYYEKKKNTSQSLKQLEKENQIAREEKEKLLKENLNLRLESDAIIRKSALRAEHCRMEVAKQLEICQQQAKEEKEQLTCNLETFKNQIERRKKEFAYTLLQKKNEMEIFKKSVESIYANNLLEREKEEAEQLHLLQVSEEDLSDIHCLQEIRKTMNQKTLINKLIWTSFFKKEASDMCIRVLKTTEKVCGIYKITNIKTKQCYIGQSVDIARRWKTHIKCGLGIDAPITNKLYNNMQKDGVWNYSFEVLEICDSNVLDQKEALWINTYQSNKFGYNSTEGNK